RRVETGRRVLWRERAQGAGYEGNASGRGRRCDARGRKFVDGVFRLSFRTGGGGGGQADRNRESRAHARRRAGVTEGDATLRHCVRLSPGRFAGSLGTGESALTTLIRHA